MNCALPTKNSESYNYMNYVKMFNIKILLYYFVITPYYYFYIFFMYKTMA